MRPLFAAVLLAVTPPDELVRRGDAAAQRDDLEAALTHYRAAAERTSDPGLSAYNQGVCQAKLGQPRAAELLFRAAADEAGERQARAQYNLGNCLVQRFAGRDRTLLRDAVRAYEQALADPHCTGPLAADARHNLELAKLLRQRAAPVDAGPDPPERADDPAPPPDTAPPESDPPGGTPDGQAGGQRGPKPGPGDPGAQAPSPGRGQLPPLPDDETVRPLTPEDLAEHLRRAEERIARDRQGRLKPSAVVPPTVKDW